MGKANVIFAGLLIIFITEVAAVFNINTKGKDGTLLYLTVCNAQTTLEFQFSSETKLDSSKAVKLLL